MTNTRKNPTARDRLKAALIRLANSPRPAKSWETHVVSGADAARLGPGEKPDREVGQATRSDGGEAGNDQEARTAEGLTGNV